MNLLYKIYFFLPNFYWLGFAGKIINRLMSRTLKILFELFVPQYLKRTSIDQGLGVTEQKRDVKYIVSLTSFPARINDIWISIETILRQSVKPDEIILWLAKEQFKQEDLPESLTLLKQRGLTIKFCDDLRSHKKYYYTIKEYPKDCVITLDDDLYYHKDVLKNVIELHKKFPDLICTNRAHEITIRNDEVLPYRKWRHNSTSNLKPSNLLMQTGGAGTLYPPNSLSPDAFDKELIRDLCFHADDIWLKFMGFINGKQVVTNSLYNKDYITVGKTQNEKLVTTNVLSGGNDTQLKKVMDYFKIKASDLVNG